MKFRIAVLGSSGAVALAGVAAFAADQTPPYVGHWPGWHGPWTGFWWVCPLMMLFMFLFFAVFWFAIRRSRGHWGPPWRSMEGLPDIRGEHGAESALEILNKRYARGEVDNVEYEEIKAAILSDGRAPGQT
jgi:putative membrane protein